MSTTLLVQSHTAAIALSALSTSVDDFRALTDVELSELAAASSPLRRLVAARDSLIAGEIARRSSRDLGQSGLAQRLGYRTPEEMVKVTTGVTGAEARRAVRVGDVLQATPSWLRAAASAVTSGRLSAASLEAIKNGLGEPCDGVTGAQLADAVARLISTGLDPDRLFRRARELRDELDEAGIADRERARYEKRSLTFTKLPDGMSRLSWLMDGETAALIGNLYDRATSPRRGGPRFVNPADGVLSRSITDDARSTDQIASDVFLHLLEAGSAADSSELLGSGGATLTVVTRATPTGPSFGIIEGQTEPVSADTIRRLTCEASTVELSTDIFGNPLDSGRDERLFTRKQRRALAYRDGGCMWPGCEREPSWTEAHHLLPWEDGGRTDLTNGILLCRHHHLLLHNEHWRITLEKQKYWLIPPPHIDPDQRPILLESKNRLLRETG